MSGIYTDRMQECLPAATLQLRKPSHHSIETDEPERGRTRWRIPHRSSTQRMVNDSLRRRTATQDVHQPVASPDPDDASDASETDSIAVSDSRHSDVQAENERLREEVNSLRASLRRRKRYAQVEGSADPTTIRDTAQKLHDARVKKSAATDTAFSPLQQLPPCHIIVNSSYQALHGGHKPGANPPRSLSILGWNGSSSCKEVPRRFGVLQRCFCTSGSNRCTLDSRHTLPPDARII